MLFGKVNLLLIMLRLRVATIKKQVARGCGMLLSCGVASAASQNRSQVMLWTENKKCLTEFIYHQSRKYNFLLFMTIDISWSLTALRPWIMNIKFTAKIKQFIHLLTTIEFYVINLHKHSKNQFCKRFSLYQCQWFLAAKIH